MNSFRLASLALSFLAAGMVSSSGAILVQELFDGIAEPPPGANETLNGKGDTTTTIGLTGTWLTNANTGIFTASNFNSGAGLPGLPSSGGTLGGVWNNTGSWDTAIYATRPFSTPIDFTVSQTIFFSVILANPGNTAMGIGFASGAGGSAEFVGAGFSWNNATSMGGTFNDARNAAYISHGNLDIDSGVYGIRAHEPESSVDGFGLLTGRITINSAGLDSIDIKRYGVGDTIDADPSTIAWSASADYDSSMLASHLVLWMNGQQSGELDAIRIGETWMDVTGVPEPSSLLLGALGAIPLFLRRRM